MLRGWKGWASLLAVLVVVGASVWVTAAEPAGAAEPVASAGTFMARTEHPIRDPKGVPSALIAKNAVVLNRTEDQVRSGFSTAGPNFGLNATYLNAVEEIATLYHLTKEPKYARWAALLLYEFSRVSMEWPVTSRIGLPDEPLEPDWIQIGHEMGRVWSTWHFYDLCSVAKLSRAYDLIYPSGALEGLGEEVGLDMKAHLEAYFDYWWKVNTVHWPPHWGNVDGHRIQCMLNYAEPLGRPAWVRESIRWLDALLMRGYLRDGMWHEGSPSYHNQVSNTLEPILNLLQGYSDPEGYVDPVEQDRLTNLDAHGRWGHLVRRIEQAVADLRLPNGKYAAIEDAHSRDGGAPLSASEPRLFPGLGYAILGAGSGEDQFQVHLNFTSPMGHEHLDGLGILIYAHGEEILSEGEYLGDRAWNSSTMAHNTVVVDQRNQFNRSSGVRRPTAWGDRSVPLHEWPSIHGHVGNFANLLAYDALSPVMMVEAEAANLYGQPVTRYQRSIVLVPRPDGAPYVVDIFRVAGGRYHDWMIHGPVHREYELLSSLQLGTRPGTLYGNVKALRQARAEDGFLLDIRADSGVGNRIHFLPGSQASTLTIGMGPAMRRAGEVPYGAIRRTGPENVFVAVHEPYRSAEDAPEDQAADAEAEGENEDEGRAMSRPVDEALRVTPLRIPAGAGDAAALQVEGNGYRDIVLATTDGPGTYEEVQLGDVRAAGRLVWIRFADSGEVLQAAVFGGGYLMVDAASGAFTLQADGDWTGTVLGSGRHANGAGADYFDVSGVLPEGDTLAGRTLVLTAGDGTRHGYRIASISVQDGQSRIFVRDDPGVTITQHGMKQLFFPNWEIPGTVRYEILGRAESF